MKRLNFLWAIIIVIPMLFTACKRDHNFGDKGSNPASVEITDPNNLVVPANFDFSMTKDLFVRVKVVNQTYQNERFRINIYIDEPSTGKVTVSGITNEQGEFSSEVRVAADLEYIYIEKMDVFGNKSFEKVRANQFVSTLFDGGVKSNPYEYRKTGSGIDCNTGCTNTFNNHTGNITISSGQVVCVTGTFSGKIYINGTGILKFCGEGTIDSLIINSTGRAYILDDAIVTIGTIKSNSSTTEFYNWSDSLISNHCVTANSLGENHGKFYIQCSFDVGSSGRFNNFGELYVTGHITTSGEFNNYDYIVTNDYITINVGATLNNYCNLTAKSVLTVNGKLVTNTYTKAINQIVIGSSGVIEMQSGAYMSTNYLINSGTIKGIGTINSIVKSAGITVLNTGSKIEGNISYCDNNGIEVNNGSFVGAATQSCSGYIPIGNCNPEGFGTFTVPDADSDGIADALDEYPNDPNRAFNQFYPCATTCSNFAFEDLWPARGDFDFNDHIVAYNLHKVFSANYEIVDFKVKVKPRAVGAGYDNGFGFSLDYVPSNAVGFVAGSILTRGIISTNANGTEAGQTHATIIVYDSPEPLLHRGGGSMFNTIQANPRGNSDTAYISLTFFTNVADSIVPFKEFNPFLFTNRRRGYEIHLPNKKPTDLANMSLFGTAADRSEPSSGKYYKGVNGLPWAIEIPENFNYPQEKISILDTYNFFDDWALSGGASYPNWFRNFGAYTNPENLFVF